MSIIYKTTNLINEKIYVGQHCSSANDGYLGSGLLLNKAVKKYGKENFKRETIEYCTSADVNEREIYWIDKLKPDYNISLGGTGGRVWGNINPFQGKHHSVETKQILRLKSLGQVVSEETKRKISKILTGRIFSEEHKRKLGESQLGIKNHRFGKQWSENHNKQISEKMLGENNPMFGKTHTDEIKMKLSKIRKGKVWITNGQEDKIIDKEEANKYLNVGWVRGRTKWKKLL